MIELLSRLKSKLVIVFMLIFSVSLFIQMGLFIAHEILKFDLKWNFFQYCLSVMDEDTIGHYTVKVVLNVAILYTLCRFAWRMYRQLYLSAKWKRIFISRKDNKLTKRLNYKYREWKVKFIIVKDDSFIAMTMGIISPEIVISTGVLQSFSPKEIEVILQHERHHCTHRDPLKIFLVTLLLDGFGYIPIFKTFHHYYRICKELLADRSVIKKMGSESHLGNVLLRFSNVQISSQSVIGVYFADVAMNYRMLQVLNPERPIQVPFFRLKPAAVSIIILVISSVVVLGGCS